ncbi:hypothetical protein [uncultured Microbacterium sp.]|uniref:hypothetical protein n=1 Tax=uncultured Microbacterium sp. TaxID=191216 RepID=UPI002607622D|nr:hypothetical protein [uncultured Microbacterium sp.]
MILSDACLIRSGFSARSRLEPDNSGMLALPQSCVTAVGELDPTAVTRVSGSIGSPQHIVHPGDVLLRSRGSTVSAWAIDDSLEEPAVALLPLYILRPTADILDAGYLAWLLMQPDAQAHFARGLVGSNIQMIKKPTIAALPLSMLPPLRNQRQIAAIAQMTAREASLQTRLITLQQQRMALRLRAHASHHDRNS